MSINVIAFYNLLYVHFFCRIFHYSNTHTFFSIISGCERLVANKNKNNKKVAKQKKIN